MVTISGSNLGQKAEDIVQSVLVADVPCTVISNLYEVSSRYACTTVVSHRLFVLIRKLQKHGFLKSNVGLPESCA